jgi:hypothetical protein
VCVCFFLFWGRCLFGAEVEDEGDVLGDLLAFYLVMKMEMLSYPRNKKDLPLFIRYMCVRVHFGFFEEQVVAEIEWYSDSYKVNIRANCPPLSSVLELAPAYCPPAEAKKYKKRNHIQTNTGQGLHYCSPFSVC